MQGMLQHKVSVDFYSEIRGRIEYSTRCLIYMYILYNVYIYIYIYIYIIFIYIYYIICIYIHIYIYISFIGIHTPVNRYTCIGCS